MQKEKKDNMEIRKKEKGKIKKHIKFQQISTLNNYVN